MTPALLPYHQRLLQWWQQHYPEGLQMAENAGPPDPAEIRKHLLTTAYQLVETDAPAAFAALVKARRVLGLEHIPVTLYQSQQEQELNAFIIPLPGEAHLVLCGPVTTLLQEAELEALMGHELAHLKLLQMPKMAAVDRLMEQLSAHPETEPVWLETARLYRLHKELFCDRGAHLVCGQTEAAISTLIKLSTGLATVSAQAYLQQAAALLAQEPNLRAQGTVHPENYLRAKALEDWVKEGAKADEQLLPLLQGLPSLDELDIFHQEALHRLTRQLIAHMLTPHPGNEGMENLARQFYADWTLPAQPPSLEVIRDYLEKQHGSFEEYACWLMLDFALVDPEMEEQVLNHMLRTAQLLGLKKTLQEILKKEKGFTAKKFDQVLKNALAAVAA